MKYPAYFYTDAEGKEPVYEYITRLPLGVRAKTYALISYLRIMALRRAGRRSTTWGQIQDYTSYDLCRTDPVLLCGRWPDHPVACVS